MRNVDLDIWNCQSGSLPCVLSQCLPRDCCSVLLGCELGTRTVSTARDHLTVVLSLKGKSITKQKPSLLRSKINFKEQNKDDELKNVGEIILGLLWGNQLV
ncbi:hypothetical protein NP493_331g06060 [Ridgeia piscesae]|uniref:Uncharacterized protein n=1 Tax=Ridgeia piscesae TaxID=27915 RepID=A0AAD9L442_RIDPI|nr:hypothetical protein NP493_331g06060 [Ridgeia piscesae]